MKMKMTGLLTLCMASVSMLAVSTSTHASQTDDRIEASAAKSYVFKTYLKDDSIKTESKNGNVTLTGTVSESSHKTLAQDTVENLPGVKGVDNELRVSGDQPPQHSDAWLRAKIKGTLLFHRHVSASGTTVYVKDGIVTLQGVTGSLAQKELTTEYVKDIENVKGVRNDMTIANTPAVPDASASEKIDDASITAEVKSSLFAHRSTSALRTKVETTDGVVTVSGIARNVAEKALVSKLINDINGVNSVINNMTIEVADASFK